MARRKPRQRSRSDSQWPAIGGAILICLAAIGFGALAYIKISRPERPTLDPVTLCPTDGPRGIAVILVDTSDDLPETTKREVRQLINDQIQALHEYHKLDIRVLDVPAARSRSLFAKCNPGDGTGLSEWTANPTIARKRWTELFRKPAEEAIRGSLSSVRAKSTPLMAAIQDIAIEEFSPAAVRSSRKALVIISDMLEHTRDYSQYPSAGDLTYERYRRSPAYLKYRTDLHGAQVTIGYVQRLGLKIDTLQHAEFWRQWIVDNRGEFIVTRRMQGAE